jgi:WD40 repeat protein
VTDLVVSPDGTRIASASTDGVGRVWPLDGGHVLPLIGHTAALTSIAFSPDGGLLVTASRDDTARIWDAAAGRPLKVLKSAFGPVADAAFSPDGRWVVTAAPVTAPVSQTSTGRLLFYLRGHTKLLTAVAFGGPNGQLIVTAARDGTMRFYVCGVCGDVHELIALAQRRLAAGG